MVNIISYEDRFQPEFKKLNLEWLDRYNLTESHDLLVLNDPRSSIIDRGGDIWLAEENGVIIGSIALMLTEEGFELAKLTVAPEYRGRGISKILIETCIAHARERGVTRLILFSNHQLVTAIKLYERFGFRHIQVEHSPFLTADVKMELLL